MRLSEIMSSFNLASYAEVSLIIFLAVFVAVVVRVYSKRHQAEYEAASLMPLDDEIIRTSRLNDESEAGEPS